MAKEITEAPAPAPTEFAVTIDEFLSEIPQAKVESKAGFTRLCQTEAIAGMKLRKEWEKLFSLYETQPTKLKWADWVKKGGN